MFSSRQLTIVYAITRWTSEIYVEFEDISLYKESNTILCTTW